MWGWQGLGKSGRPLAGWQVDGLWMLGLWLAAVVLFSVGLGDLALRDWDEGIVAQVAREIWRSWSVAAGGTPDSWTWLYPTIAGVPYLNKPTLVHWLMAQCFAIAGVNEWTARFPGAMLSALTVPMLYGIGRELFPKRTPAIFAALILLTLLPVVRHGRLAMLDGALLCFFLGMILCLLRSRRDLRWGLGIGIGFGLMCLTKGVVGFLLGAIAFLFIVWDTPRLLTSGYLWIGMLLGSAPVVGWYWAQWLRYGADFFSVNLKSQSFDRLLNSVENNGGPIWYYVWEVVKYSMPWLLFVPQGFRLAWENRTLSWAKLVLVWAGVYLSVISLMQTKLPWYVLPLYPALALVGGSLLATVWNVEDVTGVRQLPRRRFAIAWIGLLGGLAIAGWGISLYFGRFDPVPKPGLSVVLAAAALTLTIATVLMMHRDSQFILVLLWGCYVSLLMFMGSPYWLWELQEAYPVKPVAAIVQQGTPPGQLVLTSYPHSRPSLNFYSDRTVVSAVDFYAERQLTLTPEAAVLKYLQETRAPYVLVDRPILQQLPPGSIQPLAQTEDWFLITHNTKVAR